VEGALEMIDEKEVDKLNLHLWFTSESIDNRAIIKLLTDFGMSPNEALKRVREEKISLDFEPVDFSMLQVEPRDLFLIGDNVQEALNMFSGTKKTDFLDNIIWLSNKLYQEFVYQCKDPRCFQEESQKAHTVKKYGKLVKVSQ